jgi:hypothetical protein
VPVAINKALLEESGSGVCSTRWRKRLYSQRIEFHVLLSVETASDAGDLPASKLEMLQHSRSKDINELRVHVVVLIWYAEHDDPLGLQESCELLI